MAQIISDTAEQTEELAGKLAKQMDPGLVIYLQGDLGAGKTTFARGFLRGLGYQAVVKSPTYTIVQDYPLADRVIYHFDLYRIADAEELEALGFRDYFDHRSICLIEWPEKAQGQIAHADLEIGIDYLNDAREISLVARSERAQKILKIFNN